MKRPLSLWLLIGLLLLPMTTAQADAIYTPFNTFHSQHYQDCAPVYRDFYVDSPDGAPLHTEPDSGDVVAVAQNGSELRVYFTYTLDDAHWGLVEIIDEEADWSLDRRLWSNVGWLDMRAMRLIYDGISFAEDYRDQFVMNHGQHVVEHAAGVVIWPYPGAPKPLDIIPDHVTGDMGEITVLYTDDYGLLWGSGIPFYGHRQSWICLSDPTNTETGPPLPVPRTGHWEPPEAPGGPSPLTIALVLVIVVVAGTALLIRLLYRPGSQK